MKGPRRAEPVKPALLGLCIAGAVGAAAATVWLMRPVPPNPLLHFADAGDNTKVELGKRLYRSHCAACHGRFLQGQPLWQLNDKDARRRALAHDESGHTWQHSDEALFAYGEIRQVRIGAVERCVAHAGLQERPDRRRHAGHRRFIKRRWPLGLRVSQAMLNPGYAGMPPDASRVAWKLPRHA